MCLLAILVALLSFIAVGCVYFWSQFAELSNTKLELFETRLEIIEMQRVVHSELAEIRKLKQDLDTNMQLNDPSYYSPASSIENEDGRQRFKRSIAKGKGDHKSKQHPFPKRNNKKENSTNFKSSSLFKHSTKHSKGIIFLVFFFHFIFIIGLPKHQISK